MLDIKKLKNLNQTEMDEMTYRIASLIRGNSVSSMSNSVFTAAYLAYLYNKNKMKDEKEIEQYVEEQLSETGRLFMYSVLSNSFSFVPEIANTFDNETLLSFLVRYNGSNESRIGGESNTPKAIVDLAQKILDITKNESVADFGCGIGSFLTLISLNGVKANLYGVDINTSAVEFARIKSNLIGNKAEIEQYDMFMMDSEKMFDKIFSNYPFGMRIRDLQGGLDYLEGLRQRVPDIQRATSSDWIYNSLLVDHMNENGKVVAIMTNGSTWNLIDTKIRAHFVRNGLIEAVIALPAKLFYGTAIPTTMIVFSNNNKAIRMVDATKQCVEGRRQNEFSDQNISEILRLLSEDDECSTTVTAEELEQNDYVLNPARYMDYSDISIENGVLFESVIKHITRGAQLTAKDLDEFVSQEPTDTQYLMLSNIQNGIISDELPYLKPLDKKYDKYCIGNGNLLLSKNGAPFKVAVAEVEKDHKIIGNGNLFIIELDEEKVNPVYLKAFFESEMGKVLLQKISVGSTIPNISAESLKKLTIPLPELEEQKSIVDKYLAKEDEIRILRLKLAKAQDDLKNIFGEG